MAGITHSSLRRGLAALVLGAAIAVGAGIVASPQHAAAAGVPNKTCSGTGSGGAAEPGASVLCTVSIFGLVADKDTITVTPTAPAGAVISSCAGTSATSPFTYATAVLATATACTWTVVVPTGSVPALGNIVVGTETLQIPHDAKPGTQVGQNAVQCSVIPPAPVPGGTLQCAPAPLPMLTTGPGSCVGASALPVCTPPLPALTPTPTPTPTPTASSSGGGTTTADNGTTSGGVQAASTATSTPFTSGPPHPLPVAATLVAVGGGLLALAALGAPKLLRRRRGR